MTDVEADVGAAARQAHGRCLCGKISFVLDFPSKWVAHCHCTRCQRAHGAAFVTWVGAETAQLHIDDQDSLLRWYVAQFGQRAFCGNCGSSLFFKGVGWPGEVHIARAMFTDPLDREPVMHAYYDTHVSWISLADELPRKDDPALKNSPSPAP